MIDDMGIFRTEIGVAALHRPDRVVTIDAVMVDTGSEYSWLPAALLADLGVLPVRIDSFETADGRILDRPVGFAHITAGGRVGASAVVFAGPGDMILLGAHGLEALNLRIDLGRKELVPAGPAPAAVAASAAPAWAVSFAFSVQFSAQSATAVLSSQRKFSELSGCSVAGHE